MSDIEIQNLTRRVAADPADADAADALAVALVHAGRGPAFADYISAPTTEPYGNWTGVPFGSEGRYCLSIQAGRGKYSSPRQGGLTAVDYTAWEVAVCDDNGLIHVLSVGLFANMPYADHWASEGAVGPYVPSEGVQAIFDWMTLQFGRPQLASWGPWPPRSPRSPGRRRGRREY